MICDGVTSMALVSLNNIEIQWRLELKIGVLWAGPLSEKEIT